jgi:histidinol phosphatase-like PHP family hydrolase
MSAWNPQPASLRDGETRDDTHASRNLAQIRIGVEAGILDVEELDEADRERLDLDGGEQA